MEHGPVWEQTFEVRASEMDALGRLSVPALCSWLQEAAGRHARSLQWAVDDLAPRGLTWVLSRLHLRIDARPAWTEVVELATWPSGVQRLHALREFRALGPAGLPVAVATSGWLLLDVTRRRPVRPPEEIDAIARTTPPRVLDDPFAKLPEPAEPRAVDRTTARFSDLDINHHVNNVVLIRWLLDAMADGLQRDHAPCALEVEFRAEVTRGDTVEARVEAGRPGEGTFLHSLVRLEDGHEVLRARSVWRAV